MEMEELHVPDLVSPYQHPIAAISRSSSSTRKQSVPIDIPRRRSTKILRDDNEGRDDVDLVSGRREMMVPPHVLVASRRFAEKMAFSVCTGKGRTLKGRDLSHFRNSILRMTGFLET